MRTPPKASCWVPWFMKQTSLILSTCTVRGFSYCTRHSISTSVGRVFRKSRRVSNQLFVAVA